MVLVVFFKFIVHVSVRMHTHTYTRLSGVAIWQLEGLGWVCLPCVLS